MSQIITAAYKSAERPGANIQPIMAFASEHPARPQLGRPMTFEEWAAMPEADPGEFVDGRIEEEEVPDLFHQLVVACLVRFLWCWLGPGGLTSAFRPPHAPPPAH